MGRSRWQPWRALRERTHIVFWLDDLPADLGAVYWPKGDRAAVVIDKRLTQDERRAALAHELVHDELGGGIDSTGCTPELRVGLTRHEARVDRIVAERLVPHDELAELIDRLEDLGEPVRAVDVMEEFGVPVDVANLALHLMQVRRR